MYLDPDRVREAMARRGVTREALAVLFRRSYGDFLATLQGRRPVSATFVARVAEHLDVSVGEITSTYRE